MVVKEIVTLADGRDITVNLTTEEHTYLLSFAINHLVATGMLTLGGVDKPEEVIGESPTPKTVN